MNIRKLKPVFLQSMPVLAGYVSLGIAFGILLRNIGYGIFWAFGMSVFIFAGSAQFLCVTLLANHATLLSTAVLVFLLNFRHFFYGLSMITRYRKTGARKPYIIFALTDETYALLSTNKTPEGLSDPDYYFWLSLMNQSYWVLGSLIGNAIGAYLPFDSKGLDFAMTALFAVLAVEQWKAHKNHGPVILGGVITLAALLIFGPDNFLIPSLALISLVLLLFPKYWKEVDVTINHEEETKEVRA